MSSVLFMLNDHGIYADRAAYLLYGAIRRGHFTCKVGPNGSLGYRAEPANRMSGNVVELKVSL